MNAFGNFDWKFQVDISAFVSLEYVRIAIEMNVSNNVTYCECS